jgi:multiple sugar transport system permease protein
MPTHTNWVTRRLSPGQLVSYALATLAAAFFVVPIGWLISEATIGGHIGRWVFNSAFYSAAGAAIAVAFCVPAGYSIATHDFRGRRALLILTMVVMLIPTNALVLPLFLEAISFHMLTSPLAVILPYGLFPFGVYLAYIYFHTERFHAVIQTARLDGCNEWQVFARIAVPLSAPVAGLIVFLDFVASWTNYFLPWIMYSAFNTTSRYPLALGIAQQLFERQTSGNIPGLLNLHTTSPPSTIAFLLLVTAAPIVIVLGLAQRWIGSGGFVGTFR